MKTNNLSPEEVKDALRKFMSEMGIDAYTICYFHRGGAHNVTKADIAAISIMKSLLDYEVHRRMAAESEQ